MQKDNKANNVIDIVKLFCCMMIVGLHINPFLNNGDLSYYLTQSPFRIAIPFFLISTGYFFSGMESKKRSAYLKRLYFLYIFASIIYIPIYIKDGIFFVAVNFLLAFHHLWYLITVAICIQLMIYFDKKGVKHKYFLILLLPVAIFFDHYCKLLGIEALSILSDRMESLRITAYIRTLPLLLIGDYIGHKDIRLKKSTCILSFFILLAISFCEAVFLRSHTDIAAECGIFNWMPAIPLFLFAARQRSFLSSGTSRFLRKTVDIVYIIHVWVLEFAEIVLHLSTLSEYIVSIFISLALSAIFLIIFNAVQRKKAA